MKKILVVLLVLSVAWGVFAQEGEWSVSGEATVGAAINFDADNTTSGKAVSFGTSYYQLYRQWAPINGKFSVSYSKGGLWSALTVDPRDDKGVIGDMWYGGDNYQFGMKGVIFDDITTGAAGAGWAFKRLWGAYSLLNGIVYLEAAYNSRETEFWFSDKTAAVPFTVNWWPNEIYPAYNFMWEDGRTPTFVDHNQMLVIDVQLSGLSFGVMMDNLFNDTNNNAPNSPDGELFVDDVLKRAIFGVKFQMSPVEVAAQLKMENYGVYFGGKWFVGPVTVGLSFEGEFPSSGASIIAVGGSVNYNASVFGASIRGWYSLDTISSGNNTSQIGVEPGFFYNVIPTHLQFKTDIGFYFNGAKVGGDKQDMKVIWAVQPALWWNFLGTGATSNYWGMGTGMIVRYRMMRDTTNTFDVAFKWNF